MLLKMLKNLGVGALNTGKRRQMQGIVVSSKMDKTVVIAVTRKFRHSLYKRVIQLTQRYFAHSEGVAKEGDSVQIEETRPLSKNKRWRVLRVLKAAE